MNKDKNGSEKTSGNKDLLNKLILQLQLDIAQQLEVIRAHVNAGEEVRTVEAKKEEGSESIYRVIT
tara:strand:- start:181 stop:378 length:198 start_codon:yes stop_codon:yes gene_type:complete